MIEPKASRPHWPDAVQDSSKDLSALKPWQWALERLEKSHNYWISTTRPNGHPHLMLVWGVWWRDAFWGTAEEIKDRFVWKQLAQIYNSKYGGDVEPLLMASDGCVFRVTPQLAFGQDEHAENFTDAVTRWHF